MGQDDDIGLFFVYENNSHGLSHFFAGTSHPVKNKIELRLFSAHVLMKFRAMPLDLSNRSKTILLRKKRTTAQIFLPVASKKFLNI